MWDREVAGGGGGQPVPRDLTTMSVLEEESKLDLHGVPSAAVDDLPLARVALGVVLQELHNLSPDGLKDAHWMAHIQEHLWYQIQVVNSGQNVLEAMQSCLHDLTNNPTVQYTIVSYCAADLVTVTQHAMIQM